MLLNLFTLHAIAFFGSSCFGCRAFFGTALLSGTHFSGALFSGTLLRTAFAGRGLRGGCRGGSFLR